MSRPEAEEVLVKSDRHRAAVPCLGAVFTFLGLAIPALVVAAAGAGEEAASAPARTEPAAQGADAQQTRKGTEAELSLRRLEIVDAEGNRGFVLAAKPRLPAIIFEGAEKGQEAQRRRHPGVIFYNNNGDEVGGLVAFAEKKPEGHYDGGISLSIDQVGHDGQVASLMNWTEGEYARTALRINDFPAGVHPSAITGSAPYKEAHAAVSAANTEEERQKAWKAYFEMLGRERFFAERVFLGSEGAAERTAKLELKDAMSRPRLRLVVDSGGDARIEFLDADGNAVKTIRAE